MTKNILIVDDEPSIVTLVKFNLEKAGYKTYIANNGKLALELAQTEDIDLIVLDVMLPEIDGMDVLKELRRLKIETPVLLLTARDDEIDKILGLELGADDYMTKPFSPRELVARIKAILRRFTQQTQKDKENIEIIQIGDLIIYPDRFEAEFQGEQLELTPKEFELLYYLVSNQGRVLTREQLLNAVWNYDFAGDTRIVDVHVSHLREKIEKETKQPRYIKTIRGIGYKFEGGK